MLPVTQSNASFYEWNKTTSQHATRMSVDSPPALNKALSTYIHPPKQQASMANGYVVHSMGKSIPILETNTRWP